jgi:hypothetical protein
VPNEPTTNGKIFVFLPGYNENPNQSRGWESEFFKRMYWSCSKAIFWGVTWNGAQSQYTTLEITPNYHTNVVNALLTAPALATFLGGLNGSSMVAAHSLGNMVVLSALNDCPNIKFGINQYCMIDAAVAIEALDPSVGINQNMVHPAWKIYDNRLWASEWFNLWPGGDARNTLTWSNRLANFGNTEIYNFYSSGEEVLREYDGAPPSLLGATYDQALATWEGYAGVYTWVWQEKMKGRCMGNWVLGSNYGGWRFFNINSIYTTYSVEMANAIPSPQLQTNAFFSMRHMHPMFTTASSGSDYAQANRSRILADAIPALSLPVGANPVPRLSPPKNLTENNFNMQDKFENGWPSERLQQSEANKWHHSDVCYVAYPFTYKLFNEIVNDGNLK